MNNSIFEATFVMDKEKIIELGERCLKSFDQRINEEIKKIDQREKEAQGRSWLYRKLFYDESLFRIERRCAKLKFQPEHNYIIDTVEAAKQVDVKDVVVNARLARVLYSYEEQQGIVEQNRGSDVSK